MFRLRAVVAAMLLAFAPPVARADFLFQIIQDVSALYQAPSPPGDFYVSLNLISGDTGGSNNSASITDLGTTWGVTLVGAPIVLQGNASGSFNGTYTLNEGGAGLPGDATWVIQKISIDQAYALLHMNVDVTDNFAGGAPDSFTYQLLYDDDGDGNETGIGGTLPVPFVTTLAPGNSDFVQYAYLPGSDRGDVIYGGPLPGFNPFPLDNVGPATVPEPTTLLIWGATLGAVGMFRRRQRLLAASSV